MKKILSSLALCTLLLPSLFGQTWETLSVPSANRFDDVFFLPNKMDGWTCNSSGFIYHTADGGQNWTKQFGTGGYSRSIEFLDDTTGFCGVIWNSKPLFRTTDGGKSWQNISSLLPGYVGGICGLCAVGPKTVYGVGIWSGPPSYFIKSTDGGQTFQCTDMSNLATNLVDVYFVTPDSGFISGTAKNSASNGGIILSTSDGGATWHTKILTGVAYDIVWKIQSPDGGKHLFASIERSGPNLKTQIIKSSDGGQNWSLKTVAPMLYRLQMIGFLDTLLGYTGDMSLFKTTDGGESWEKMQSPPGLNFDRFHRLDDNTAIVTGSELYRLSKKTSPVTEAAPPRPAPYRVMQLMGNPASHSSSVLVDLEMASFVSLRILGIDGRGAQTILCSRQMPAGEHLFPIPFEKLERGLHVVILKTNYGTEDALLEVF